MARIPSPDAVLSVVLSSGCGIVSHVMTTDAACPQRDSGTDVMASLDGDGPDSRLVIADISRDEAWVSMTEDDATPLSAWR